MNQYSEADGIPIRDGDPDSLSPDDRVLVVTGIGSTHDVYHTNPRCGYLRRANEDRITDREFRNVRDWRRLCTACAQRHERKNESPTGIDAPGCGDGRAG